jgi:hypothetical protein
MLDCCACDYPTRSGTPVVDRSVIAWLKSSGPQIHRWRWCLLLLAGLAAKLEATPLPPELTEALDHFRAEGPKGWSFIQTTEAGGDSLVERFDAAEPDFKRWTLVKKNGRAPTADELLTYNEGRTRRSACFTAPRIQDQLDTAHALQLHTEPGRSVWRMPLKAGGADDGAAAFMAVTLTFHESTHTIEQVEIASTGPFSPVLAVKILETKTVMFYSLPTKDRPSLLQRATLHVQGRAFWFKSLDQDMTVTFSEQALAGKK